MDDHLKLEEFIYQVKKELIEAQEKHKGEQGFFALETVELEIKITTSRSVEGKAKLEFWVVSLGEAGGKLARDDVHTVKLSFRVAAPKLEPAISALRQEEEEILSFKVADDLYYIPVNAVQMNLQSVEPYGRIFAPPGQGTLPSSQGSSRAQELIKKMISGMPQLENIGVTKLRIDELSSCFGWPKRP